MQHLPLVKFTFVLNESLIISIVSCLFCFPPLHILYIDQKLEEHDQENLIKVGHPYTEAKAAYYDRLK